MRLLTLILLIALATSASGQIDCDLNGFRYFNEFLSDPSTTGDGGMYLTNSGTGAGSLICGCAGLDGIGILNPATGSTSTGRTALATSNTALEHKLGTYVYEVYVPSWDALSNGTQRYALLFGFIDNYTSVNQTDGAYFLYDEGGVSTSSAASANWQTVTAAGGSRTFNTTSTAFSTSGFKLRIETEPLGGNVYFYIDGTLIRTETATIPNSVGQRSGAGFLYIKSIGSSNITGYIDYISLTGTYKNTK